MFMFILCNNILIKATRRLGCLFCSFSLCACQSTLSSVWCDVGIWWSGHKVFRNIPQPRHEPFPLLASATGKQRLIVLQLTVYNALTHLDNNKLNGETSCIPTPVPASVQSVSGQSFMIEILQRCQHNNTTTNVHFNGLIFLSPQPVWTSYQLPTCLWTLGWCRLQIALLFCLCNCLIDLRWSIFQVYWQIWIVTTTHCLLSSKRRAMARRVTMAGSQESHHAKSKWWIPPQFIQVFWSQLCVLYSLFISETKM